MSKNLIIYYSRKGQNYVNGRIESLTKGNTEICAEFIQKAVGGDLFEVETVNGYSSDYHACTAEAKTEYENNTRPELKALLFRVSLNKKNFTISRKSGRVFKGLKIRVVKTS